MPAAPRPVRTLLLVAVTALLAGAAPLAAQDRLASVTAPLEAFGFELGADYRLANYQDLLGYWQTLAGESDRMVLDTIGTTEEGRPQLMAILTSPENHRNLERYRRIAERMARARSVGDEAEARRLAEEGKAVVWFDGGLHATEVLGAQQLMQFVYDMVSLTDDETQRFLDDVIVLALHANPDGHDLVADWYNRNPVPEERSSRGIPVLYEKYAGHDNNRDFYMANLAETQNMNRVAYTEWYPQIMYNHHQTGPEGTIMFAPPFRDPPNHNIHPLMLTNLQQVGSHMHARFVREGKGGTTMRSGAGYSTWWNGGLRTTPYFHNMIGLLTETIGNPTPIQVPFIPDRQLTHSDLPLPVEPTSEWKFKWSIDYSQTANRAVLDFASRNRELLLLNIWTMGRDAIEAGETDTWDNTPREIYAAEEELGRLGDARDYDRLLKREDDRQARGYVIPADQDDFNTAVKFVNALLMNGVEVQRATRPFTAGGERYSAGSFVVRTNQAFAPHVFDMFEPQDHPDDFAYPGGPPIPPYDLTGWTLAYQMGVEVDRLVEGFDGPFEAVDAWNLSPEPGTVSGPSDAAGYLLDHRVNDAFTVVERVLEDGGDVYWLTEPVSADGERWPAGAFWVESGGTARGTMEGLAAETGVDVRALARRPSGPALELGDVRIGLWDEYGGSMTSGWLRYTFDHFGIDHELVYPSDLEEGSLNDRWDVLIFPEGAIATNRRRRGGPMDPSDVPAEYRDRLGEITEETVPRIMEFVREGGTVIALGGSTVLGEMAGLPVSDHLVDRDGTPLEPEEFFIPGSLLEVDLDPVSPVVQGLDDEIDVLFARDPVWAVDGNAPNVKVLGRYDAERPLRSGWAWNQEKVAGDPALLEVEVGEGKLFLFGNDLNYRGQTHGAFPLIFNAIYYGPAEATTLR